MFLEEPEKRKEIGCFSKLRDLHQKGLRRTRQAGEGRLGGESISSMDFEGKSPEDESREKGKSEGRVAGKGILLS